MKIEQVLKTNTDLPLPKKAIINLLYITNLINSKLNEVLKPFDISLQQFNVLRILRGQKGNPASLSTIQERMINKMSNTTRLVDKLIKKKFVKKTINENNRRKIDVIITQEGLNLLKKVDVVIDSAEKNIIKPLTGNETKELNRLLGKIRLIAN